MYDLDVSFTNNQAQRDLRPMKIHRKVSSCFRSQAGVERLAHVRSLSATRKNDVGALDVLTRLFNGDPWMPEGSEYGSSSPRFSPTPSCSISAITLHRAYSPARSCHRVIPGRAPKVGAMGPTRFLHQVTVAAADVNRSPARSGAADHADTHTPSVHLSP